VTSLVFYDPYDDDDDDDIHIYIYIYIYIVIKYILVILNK